MFKFETEQRVCEVGEVMFGGQSGQYPAVVCSSIFQKRDKVFEGKRKEIRPCPSSPEATILRRRSRLSLAGVMIFVLFVGVAAMVSSAASEPPQLKSSLEADDSVTGRSRVTLNGVEYIKINLGELYQLSLDAKSDKIADHYVVRGIVRRTHELDSLGQFALIRTAVVCCHAHAAPVGFRVDYNRSSEIRDGQWVEVYGTLKKLSPDLPNPNLHSVGILFVRLNKSRCIVPIRIVKIPQPEDPDISEFRSAEPYAY